MKTKISSRIETAPVGNDLRSAPTGKQVVAEIEFDESRVGETALFSLSDAYVTTLCRQNGCYFLHTSNGFGSSLDDIRLVNSTSRAISAEEANLLLAIFVPSNVTTSREGTANE